MNSVVYHNAYALLTLAETERSAKLYLIVELVLFDQRLDLLNYLTRAFDMAGASYTYCNLHKFNPRIYCYF